MLSQEVRDLGYQIANMSEVVSPEVWTVLAIVKNNLLAIAENMEELEQVPLAPEGINVNIDNVNINLCGER